MVSQKKLYGNECLKIHIWTCNMNSQTTRMCTRILQDQQDGPQKLQADLQGLHLDPQHDELRKVEEVMSEEAAYEKDAGYQI